MKNKKANPATSGRYRTPDRKALIEWEIKPGENGPEFSASGEYDDGCGQCIDSIEKAYPDDLLIKRIFGVWKVYHLNGMNAGTPEQMAFLEANKSRSEREDYYDWAVSTLKRADLYEVPLPDAIECTGSFPDEVVIGKRGYRYGERWLHMPLPESVIAEVKSWSDDTPPDDGKSLVELKAEELLTDNGIKMRVTLSNSKPANWEPSGNHYRVTLSRKGTGSADKFPTVGSFVHRMTFDFWGSVADAEEDKAPDAYTILACVSSDINVPETFEDYCSEFGADPDSIKELQTFRRGSRFGERLRGFFTDAEREQLQEIQ